MATIPSTATELINQQYTSNTPIEDANNSSMQLYRSGKAQHQEPMVDPGKYQSCLPDILSFPTQQTKPIIGDDV